MPAPPDHALVVENLVKVYDRAGAAGGRRALDDVTMAVPRGAIFALLGPNGAGKSTLINILAGLTVKTAGRASIWGVDIDAAPRQARAAIGVVPQELNIDPFFTPRETLELQAGLFGVPPSERRTAEILDLIDLTDKAGAYARALSGGMRRRLLIGKALVHAPPVLILDEPTAGVDIELRQRLWDNVRELNRAGMTILLTTHYLEEAEQLCDWIAIINHGRLIAAEPKATILARLDQKDVVATVRQDLSDWPLPAALVALAARVVDRHRLRISYRPREIPVQGILAALTGAGLDLVDIATHESDLEDIFLDLTRGAAPPPAP